MAKRNYHKIVIFFSFLFNYHCYLILSDVQYCHGQLAQLDRVSGFEPEGYGFDSCIARHIDLKNSY